MTTDRCDRLVQEGEDLDRRTLVSAKGDRRWKATRLESPHPRRFGYPRDAAVYDLFPLGGDVFGFGGVKAIVRSEQELVANRWRIAG
jgi:hypothetical protein